MKIRIGDNVIVRTGKDRGQSGVVAKVYQGQDKVLIEGVNQKIKHVKGRDGVPGERAEFFAPIHISNVSIVDPKDGKAARVGYLVDAKGAKTRISKRSGQTIVKAAAAKKEAPKAKASKEPKKIKA